MEQLKRMLVNLMVSYHWTNRDAEEAIENATIIIKSNSIKVSYQDGGEDYFEVRTKEYLVLKKEQTNN